MRLKFGLSTNLRCKDCKFWKRKKDAPHSSLVEWGACHETNTPSGTYAISLVPAFTEKCSYFKPRIRIKL